MIFKQLAGMPLVPRVLLSLAFGLLAGFLIRHHGLGILYLVVLGVGTAMLSAGLGAMRLLVAVGVWLGQYLFFRWSFLPETAPPPETVAIVLVIHQIFIFLPAVAVLMGAYIGLVAERILQKRSTAAE